MDKCPECGEEMQSFMTHKCKPNLFKDVIITDFNRDMSKDERNYYGEQQWRHQNLSMNVEKEIY